MDTSQDDFVSLTFEKLFFPLLKTLQMAAVLRGRAVCPSPPLPSWLWHHRVVPLLELMGQDAVVTKRT